VVVRTFQDGTEPPGLVDVEHVPFDTGGQPAVVRGERQRRRRRRQLEGSGDCSEMCEVLPMDVERRLQAVEDVIYARIHGVLRFVTGGRDQGAEGRPWVSSLPKTGSI